MEMETADLNRIKALGVVTNENIPNKESIDVLFDKLDFESEKEDVMEERLFYVKENNTRSKNWKTNIEIALYDANLLNIKL